MNGRISTGVLALILSASLMAIWWVWPDSSTVNPPTSLPNPVDVGQITINDKATPRVKFYLNNIVPLLDAAKKRNETAVDTAVHRLHEEFERYRNGIPGFAKDVTSWSTRFAVAGRYAKQKAGEIKDKAGKYWNRLRDWWSEDQTKLHTNDANKEKTDEIKLLMIDKFQSHIMPPGSLKKAIDSSLEQFRSDIERSRNQLLSEIKLAVTTGDVQLGIPPVDWVSFQKEFSETISAAIAKQGMDSVQNAAVTLVASSIGTWAAEQLVARLLSSIATMAVNAGVTAASSVGSGAASGGALGGAVGWIGGPAGEAIGVGAGLAIGMVVDWWMTDRFETNLNSSLNTYLNQLEKEIKDGLPETSNRNRVRGLQESLRDAVNDADAIQRNALLKALQEAK